MLSTKLISIIKNNNVGNVNFNEGPDDNNLHILLFLIQSHNYMMIINGK